MFFFHDGTVYEKKEPVNQILPNFLFRPVWTKISLEKNPCIYRQAFKWRTATNKKTARCQGVASSLCHLLRLFDEAQCTFSAYGLGEDRSFRAEGADKMGCWECFFLISRRSSHLSWIPKQDSQPFRIFWFGQVRRALRCFLGDCFETTHSETNTVCDVKCKRFCPLFLFMFFSRLLNPSTFFFSPQKIIQSSLLRVLLLPDGGDGSWANAFGTLGKLCGVLQILESEAWTPKGREGNHWMTGDSERGCCCCWLVHSKRVESWNWELENPDSKEHVFFSAIFSDGWNLVKTHA